MREPDKSPATRLRWPFDWFDTVILAIIVLVGLIGTNVDLLPL